MPAQRHYIGKSILLRSSDGNKICTAVENSSCADLRAEEVVIVFLICSALVMVAAPHWLTQLF